jgi:hypothetical protein
MSLDRIRRFANGYVLLALALFAVGLYLLLIDIPAVVLSWETASEVGTAGFNVFRAPAWETAAEEQWTKVNAELIPAEGDELSGANYVLEDEGLTPGRRYHYRIEEVEWDGTTTRYPDEVVIRAGLPRRWTKLEGGFLIALALYFIWRRVRGRQGG